MTAWRGQPPLADMARAIMADERHDFVSCENVSLELIAKPVFEKRTVEVLFYDEYFSAAKYVEPFSPELGAAAFALARKYGLAAGDALNLASAIRQDADEFVTSESPGKPLFRVRELRVVTIRDATLG